MNSVNLVGRLTRDLELRETNTGRHYVTFNLAVDGGQAETEFIRCRAWNKVADGMSKYLFKGSLISVEGRIHTFKTVKDDHTNYVTEVVAQTVRYLSSKKKEESSQSQQVDETVETPEENSNATFEASTEMDYAMSLTAEAELAGNELKIDEDDLPF